MPLAAPVDDDVPDLPWPPASDVLLLLPPLLLPLLPLGFRDVRAPFVEGRFEPVLELEELTLLDPVAEFCAPRPVLPESKING